MTLPWVILPGMTMPPDDFAALAAALPGETLILEAYQTALTAPAGQVRAWFQEQFQDRQRDRARDRSSDRATWDQIWLVGHSAGAMTALEWLLTFPEEIAGAFLLEPTDPDEKPSRLLPGTPLHRLVAALLSAVGRWPWLARRLGRAGRRAFWRLFTKRADHLTPSQIDRIWGNRRGLLAVWYQVFDRFIQERRVRQLLATSSLYGVGGDPPADQSATELTDQPTRKPADQSASKSTNQSGGPHVPAIYVIVGDSAEPFHSALASRLGGRFVVTTGDHLFPVLQPKATAALITDLAGQAR
ncbi:MAG: alpha/beta hydrolase [Bifidobacteriaceae bacterium]|nr:alpha/beta hydrolase [Bifidobacteriaceae bacterium]